MFGRLLRASGLVGAKRVRQTVAFFNASDLPPGANRAAHADLVAACALVADGRGEQAVQALQRQSRSGSDPTPTALLAFLLEALGRGDAAAAGYRAARLHDGAPALALHLVNRGREYLNRNAPDLAVPCLQLAARLQPDAALPLEMLGFAGYLSGDVAAAGRWYDQAMARAAASERGALALNRLINTIPQIAASGADFKAARAAFETELQRLLADPPRIDDPLAAINRTAFFLAYQGQDDRATLEALARLFLKACPGLAQVAAHARDGAAVSGRRPRVGVVSMNLGRHSVGAWYRDYVRLLFESDAVEISLFTYGGAVDDALRQAAERHGTHAHIGPGLDQARARIAAARLDLLIHTDVAMHPFMYFLAFSRLAPRQALLVGHPATSGIPAIDYFLSNVHQDSATAQAHYSERLVRLPLIGVQVRKTTPPARPLSRADLGLADGVRYYVCPMMLQKMHPDFDWALGEILRRDTEGEVLLFTDPARGLWQTQLEARLTRTLGRAASRVTFRPFAAQDEFLSLLLAADCVLDPFHFSGGVTTYAVLSLACPLVTLPGEFFRGRMSAGILAQAGVDAGVATSPEHYVELALRFAHQPALRQTLRERIIAAHAALFETSNAVSVLQDWIAAVTSEPAQPGRHTVPSDATM